MPEKEFRPVFTVFTSASYKGAVDETQASSSAEEFSTLTPGMDYDRHEPERNRPRVSPGSMAKSAAGGLRAKASS